MIKFIAENNQSLIDIAIQTAGTSDAVFELIAANNFQFDFMASLPVGTEVIIPNYSAGVINTQVLNYLQKNNIKIATDNINQTVSNWILVQNFWNDDGIWIDTELWQD